MNGITAHAADRHCAESRNGLKGNVQFTGRDGDEPCDSAPRTLKIDGRLAKDGEGVAMRPNIVLSLEVSGLYPDENPRVAA
jgi:hypothetical protein